MFTNERSTDRPAQDRWDLSGGKTAARLRAGRRRAVAVIGVVLATMTSVLAGSASPASAVTTSTFYYVSLPNDVTVPPNNTDAYPVVLTTDLMLQAGETRRVLDQLDVTLSSSEGAEVDNRLVCLDPSNGAELARASSGTNHRGSGAGELKWTESLLLTAPRTGTFTCQIQANTSDGSRTGYHMTVVRSGRPFTTNGTWLQISSADEVDSHAWSHNTCNSPGTFETCVFLGGSGDPMAFHVFVEDELHPGTWIPNPDIWTARTDTTTIDLVGTYQITSCPNGTSSCPSWEWGDGGINRPRYAQVWSYLQFDQLYPDGSVCRIHQSFDPSTSNVYYIDNSVHHLPIAYQLTAPVSPNCGGSRRFRAQLVFLWVGGNPVKLDGGTLSVINSVRTTTTTVPYVLGSTEAQATSAIQAAGLTASTIDRVINAAPQGTVFEQNSPGGTVEPTGSQVYLRVSLGQSVVPNVMGWDMSSAMQAITAANLTVGTLSFVNTCVDPGSVQMQNPWGGTAVLPGTSVDLQISTCNGGGGGDDPWPK